MSERNVAVIGGGAAGLAAARALLRAGVNVDLFEARDRLGGRVLTRRHPEWPMPLELGAEFVHGRPEITSRLLEEAGLHLVPLADRHHWSVSGARSAQRQPVRELGDFWTRVSRILSRADPRAVDCSAAEFASRVNLQGEERALFELFVRGYHAAPLESVGIAGLAREASESQPERSTARIREGYGGLIAWLSRQIGGAENCGVHLECQVKVVSWRRGRVTLDVQQADRHRQFSARAALLTVPVGVLAARPDQGGLIFDPPLVQKQTALSLGDTSHALKVVLCFRERFWNENTAPEFEFLHDPSSPFLTFWRQAQGSAEQITAWAGGLAARDPLSPQAAVKQALETFCALLDVEPRRARAALLGHHLHDFSADPFARGAYSHVVAGGKGFHELLAQPVDETLYFAGEATDAEFPATVAGALASGERAAREMMS